MIYFNKFLKNYNKKMNFFDVLQQTSYNEEKKNYVASFIMDYFSEPKSNNIYLVKENIRNNYNNSNNIFLIEKTLDLKEIPAIIKILIFINSNFPDSPPSIYLERAEMYSIIDIQKDVDKSTFEITLNSIKQWRDISDIQKILSDIISSFNKIYPLYKLEIHKRKGVQYPLNSFVPNDAIKVSLNSNSDNYSNLNYYRNQPQIRFEEIIFINDGFNKQEEDKITFEDEEIKKILIDHTLISLKSNFIRNNNEIENTRISMENMKKYLNNDIIEISNKIIEGKKMMNSFGQLYKEIKSDIITIKDHIIINSRKKISLENYRDFIDIPNKQEYMLKLMCMESTLDDFIFSIKKGFEKNILSFDESMKHIRKFSKEIYVINYLRNKLNDE